MPANKDLFLKWLLAVVLLLSFFTFSGVIVLSLAKPNPSQTETAFIAKKQATKSILWQRVLNQINSLQNTLPVFATSTIDLAYFDNLRAKTLSISSSNINIGKRQNSFTYQHKTILHSKSDDPYIALT